MGVRSWGGHRGIGASGTGTRGSFGKSGPTSIKSVGERETPAAIKSIERFNRATFNRATPGRVFEVRTVNKGGVSKKPYIS